MKLTQERLKEVIEYDSEIGEFWWRKNKKNAGGISERGYLQIRVDGKLYQAHRLAWLYVYGYFPEHGIDHINRIKDDNAILNLREVSQSCNVRNSKGSSPYGVKGIFKVGKNWRTKIRVGDKLIFLGTFSTKLGAAKARVEAEEKYGFVDCDKLSEAKIFVNSQPPEESGSRVTKKVSGSGIEGVCWDKSAGKWRADICRLGIKKYLGLYSTIQEAAEARKRAEL